MDDVSFRELYGLTEDDKKSLIEAVSQDITFDDEESLFETETDCLDEVA